MSTSFNPRAKWKGGTFAVMLAVATLCGGTATAQDFTVGWHPRSGDVWVDTWLGDMNRYGARYREPFIDELVRYHGAPRPLVVDLLDRRWAPGDIYLACSIASIIGRPCRYVVDVYDTDRGQGWGVIAKRLGIKPGSPEFHRLKQGFVPTYDRWARPIELDVELQRSFPDRGKGSGKGHGSVAHGKDAHGKGSAKSDHGGAKSGSAKGSGRAKQGASGDRHGGGHGQGHSGQSGGGQGGKKGGKGHGKD